MNMRAIPIVTRPGSTAISCIGIFSSFFRFEYSYVLNGTERSWHVHNHLPHFSDLPLLQTCRAKLITMFCAATVFLTLGLRGAEEEQPKDTRDDVPKTHLLKRLKAEVSLLGVNDFVSRQIGFDKLVGRVRVFMFRLKILQLGAEKRVVATGQSLGSNEVSQEPDPLTETRGSDISLDIVLPNFAERGKISFRLEDKTIGKLKIQRSIMRGQTLNWEILAGVCDHYGLFIDETDSKDGVYVIRKRLDRMQIESLLSAAVEGKMRELPWVDKIDVEGFEELRRGSLLLLLLFEEMQNSVDPEVTKMLRLICKQTGLPYDLKCPVDGLKRLLNQLVQEEMDVNGSTVGPQRDGVPSKSVASPPTPDKSPDQPDTKAAPPKEP